MDIAAWLRESGLERYEQALRDNDVDAKVLPNVTAEDLKEIGITSVGHRRSLLAAIETLRPETAIPEPEEPSTMALPAAEPWREAEGRQLTVMFVDLVGSTALSARLTSWLRAEDPECEAIKTGRSPIEIVIVPRARDIDDFEVRRALT